MKKSKLIILSLLIIGSIKTYSHEIWVSPNGSDKNPGTKEKPMATILMAQRKVRELRRLADPSIKDGVHIILKGGIYNYTFTLKGIAFNTIPNANIPQIPLPDINENGTETMIVLGLGYLFKLGKRWYVDLKGNYNFLTNAFAINEPVNPEDPNAIYGVKGTVQYVSFLAGINYRF